MVKKEYQSPKCCLLDIQARCVICLSTPKDNIIGWEGEGFDGQLDSDL